MSEPGSMERIFESMCDFACDECGHDPLRSDKHPFATVRETITALRTELADAKQRVAELENEVQRVTRNCQHNLDGKREQERLKKLYLKQLREAMGITHIPGKEDDDGEMH